ncbi:DUF4124 domain-containing protein [Pseudothauera rhizosphaerae]|nr:DUF4124 domain-containing protein [Pseudothauera rhizosphaerae]
MALRSARLSLAATLLVLSVPLFYAQTSQADIYTWKDRSGQVHYADTPPLTGDATVVGPVRRVSKSESEEAAASAEGQEPTLADKELEFRQRRAAEADAAAKTEQEEKRAADRQRACDSARGQLATLQNNQRVARVNAQGEREFLDDDTRTQEAERIQAFLDQNCSQ